MTADAPAPKIDPQQTRAAGEFKYTSPLLTCRFDASGQFAFATAQDNAIIRWHLASGKATVLAGHDSWVRTLAVHPSGSTLYSGGYEGRVIFWEASAEAPQPVRTLEAHRGWVRTATVSPDGNLLATCGNDNLVKLWNAADGTLLAELIGHRNHVYNVAFHPSRPTIVSGDLKGVVIEWDLASGEELRSLDAGALWKYDGGFQADIGGVRSIAFGEGGNLLACGGITEVSNAFAGIGNPLVIVFDFASGAKRQSLVTTKKFRGTASGLRFLPEGLILGSTSGHDGGHLLFWKLDQPNEAFDFKMPDVAFAFDLHPDGSRVCTAHEDKTLRLWDITAKG